jgi:hypothetical protein
MFLFTTALFIARRLSSSLVSLHKRIDNKRIDNKRIDNKRIDNKRIDNKR